MRKCVILDAKQTTKILQPLSLSLVDNQVAENSFANHIHMLRSNTMDVFCQWTQNLGKQFIM